LLVKELYLYGSNSGRIEVQASFSRPGSREACRFHLASAAAGVTPMAGEIKTRLAGTGVAVLSSASRAKSRASGAPVE